MIPMSPQISQCAGMRRDDICIYVSPSNRARLTALIDDRNTPSKVAWRAEIVLATADGHGTNEIMRRTGKSKPCVWRWQERYVEEGVLGLMRDKTRPSRKPPLPDKVKLAVLTKTADETPANATHWSRATMAAEIGISPSSVGRIGAEAGLKPPLVHRLKISNDPQFEEKVTDVVGLYMNPPERALVLCVDEKSQIQALDRTQPGLPLKEGPCRDHDSRLQAAWHDDPVRCAGCEERHRHRRMPAASPRQGVHPFPEANRPVRAEAPRHPPRD